MGFPVIDLTTIFNDVNDYANHIEPDVQGGKKMVENIFRVMDQHSFEQSITSLYGEQTSTHFSFSKE